MFQSVHEIDGSVATGACSKRLSRSRTKMGSLKRQKSREPLLRAGVCLELGCEESQLFEDVHESERQLAGRG